MRRKSTEQKLLSARKLTGEKAGCHELFLYITPWLGAIIHCSSCFLFFFGTKPELHPAVWSNVVLKKREVWIFFSNSQLNLFPYNKYMDKNVGYS